jgi:hypothetical protein
MNKKLIILILFFFSITNLIFAQAVPYFSFQKIKGGVFIGVEVFDKKTKISKLDREYKWSIPSISAFPQKTPNNFIFVPLKTLTNIIYIDLNYKQNIEYSLNSNILTLPSPKVKIVKKNKYGILLPLSNLEQDDTLTVVIKNFSSKKLTYRWTFNQTFISDQKEISIRDLKEKSGLINVEVFDVNLKEKAEDSELINIE